MYTDEYILGYNRYYENPYCLNPFDFYTDPEQHNDWSDGYRDTENDDSENELELEDDDESN